MRLPLKPPMELGDHPVFAMLTLIASEPISLDDLLRARSGPNDRPNLGILPGARVALLDGRSGFKRLQSLC
jgi:hypothetical protein